MAIDGRTFPPADENRLYDALMLHSGQEVAYRINNPAARRNDPSSLLLREQHYQSILIAYGQRRELTPQERATRRFVAHEVRHLRLRRLPRLPRVLYRMASTIGNALVGRRANIRLHRAQVVGYEKAMAISQNTQTLTQQLQEAGFQLPLDGPLRSHLKHLLPTFALRYSDPNYPKTDFLLRFQRLPGADAYFFAGFDAVNRADLRHITVSPKQEPPLSAREAAQLVSGRPVLKTIDGQSHWYGMSTSANIAPLRSDLDLSTALSNLPIKEMAKPIAADNLVRALAAGGEREVTIALPNRREEKVLLRVASDARSLVFRQLDGRYLDIADYNGRLARAAEVKQQLDNRKLQPVTAERPALKR